MKKPGLVLVFLVSASLTLVALACGGSNGGGGSPNPSATPTASAAHTLDGRFLLTDSFQGTEGASCEGENGYSDIREGAQVVVRDSTGVIIATSRLDAGRAVPTGGLKGFMYCQFTFTVPGIPPADFYTIEVSHRGQLTYSRDDLERQAWTVDLTLDD